MSKLFIIGDLHFDKLSNRSNFHIEDITSKQIQVISSIFDKATEEDMVILLGDISHYNIMTDESKVALLNMLLAYEHIDTRIICGNHDYEKDTKDSLNWLKPLITAGKLPNLHIYTDVTVVKKDKTNLCFVPYPYTKANIDKGIAFGHFTRPGAKSDNGRVLEEGIAQDDNLLWVNGHLHTYQTIKSGKAKTIYVGTPYQTTPMEQTDKGYLVIDLVTKHIEWIKLNLLWQFIYTEDEDTVNSNTDDSIIYILKGKTQKKNVIQSYGKTYTPTISATSHLDKWLKSQDLEDEMITKVLKYAKKIEEEL